MENQTPQDDLQKVWNKFILTVAEEFKVIVFLDWLADVINKIDSRWKRFWGKYS